MGRKLVLLALVVILLLGGAHALGEDTADMLFIHPGETMAAPAADAWSSNDETVAKVDAQGNIAALAEGICQIQCVTGGQTAVYTLTVSDKVPTELIKKAIAIAENEFVTLDGNSVKKINKYSKWYNNGSFGWCGAFVGWCFGEAGIPMSRVGSAEKVDDSVTWAISEAAVGKILKGYQKMERTTLIPKPGYMVIYSVTGKPYNNIHTGMVVQVEELGEGKYLLTTIEGNVSSRVKKYQYYYDSTDEAAKKMQNMQALPQELQTDEKISYKLHDPNWYVKVFCQTYN